MGSLSALPALDVKDQPQPDLLQKFGQLQQLQGQRQQLQTAQQMAPLQVQQAQQGVAGGAIDLQQKQIQLKDQQAMSAAMQEWGNTKPSAASATSPASAAQLPVTPSSSVAQTPPANAAIPSSSPTSAAGTPATPSAGAMSATPAPRYEDLISLAIKNGASAATVIGLKKNLLEMQSTAAGIAKDDAQTGQNNAEAMKTKIGIVNDSLSSVLSLPDNQLAQGIMAASNDLSQKGLLDPQHVQMAQSLAQQAQSGDVAGARQHLQIQIKSMGGFANIITDAQKQADLASTTANTTAKNAELDYYAKNGGAPGVPIEAQQQADWLAKNPGKGPSDFVAWKAKQSPMAMVMGNMMGGGQQGQQGNPGLDFAANNYRLTGQMPAGLTRSPGSTVAVIQRAAQLDQQDGGQGIAANKSVITSYRGALDSLQKNYSQVQAFEDTANKNIDLLQQTAQKIPDLGTRFANVPVRMISGQMIGTANMAAFKTALQVAQTESARVLSTANASGVALTDSMRKDLQDMVNGNMTLPAMTASLNTLKQDMSNRTQAYQANISDLQGKIKNAGTPTAAQPGTAQGAGQNNGNNAFAQFGGVAH